MAHETPEGGYRVFWRSYLLEALPSPAGRRIAVTSLYPRKFPLVRYDIGDEVELPGAVGEVAGLAEFPRVIGRCNDAVILHDGSVIHSEVFTHAVRACPEVAAYQVVQTGDDLEIRYLSSARLTEERVQEILSRLAKVHPRLAHVSLERVEVLQRSIAGKTPMVVRRSAT